MANQTGISINIKAFIETGRSVEAQFHALSTLKLAHETGDYSEALKLAIIDEVKSEIKTRRDPNKPSVTPADERQLDIETYTTTTPSQAQTSLPADDVPPGEEFTDDDVPAFLRRGDAA